MELEKRASSVDRTDAFGLELVEIKPVVLGGDPFDVENKTWLTRQQHIEFVRYWNRVIRDLRKGVLV